MDTTTSTVGGDDVLRSGYVSCIKVDGIPILPPVMTEDRRREMRHYKELAMLKEKILLQRRISNTNLIKTATKPAQSNEPATTNTKASTRDPLSHIGVSHLSRSRSPSTSPIPGVPATSTPRAQKTPVGSCVTRRDKGGEGSVKSLFSQSPDNPSTSNPSNMTNVPEGVLRERKIVPPIDPNKSMISEPSESSAMSYDGDEEKVEETTGSDNESEENFASAASSTGTFVIRRSDQNQNRTDSVNKESPVLQVVTSSEEEIENDENAPPTVVRKPSLEEPVFKRKRPAKYFDMDDGDSNIGSIDATPKSSCSRYSDLPNSVLHNENNQPGTVSFSPIANTNFTALAKSLTAEFTQKFGAVLASSSSCKQKQTKSTLGSYDVTLSRDIPSSAEKLKDGNDVDNSSDKENVNSTNGGGGKRHVRKLSYTLAAPSAVLLEAASKERSFTKTLEAIPSAASSVGVASAYQSPEKPNILDKNETEKVNATLVLDNSSKYDRLNTALVKLQELNLGQGKQAHLERFLGDHDQRRDGVLNKTTSSPEFSPLKHDTDLVESVLTRMKEEQERKLKELAEHHRQQELRIRQEFESEIEKLKEKLSSTLNTTESSKSYKMSPNSLIDFSRSPKPATDASVGGTQSILFSEETGNSSRMVTSGMSGMSLTEQTRVGGMPVYQFTGEPASVNTINSGMSSSARSISGLHASTDLAGIGLSKLQSRMQLMSPGLFRVPVDARSPLLKGLVFPDPLDKPHAPIRIPPKSLDPSMKPKFDRVSAVVKGYLTRRLLNTEKVQMIVHTCRDTVDLLLKLYEEGRIVSNKLTVKSQDADLHQRLLQQLRGACQSFYEVFFKLSTAERMAIIASDREKLKAKALKNLASPAKRNLSNATLKSIERRMSHRLSPKRESRKSRNSVLYDPSTFGSQSVKPKPIKSFNISPKRRRISYWDDKNSTRRSAASTNLVGKQDLNGNSFKVPSDSARSQNTTASSRTRSYQTLNSGINSETFIVPSATPTNRGIGTMAGVSNNGNLRSQFSSGRRDSTKSVSARSTPSAMSAVSASSRPSTSRQPWNSVRR